jgi:hypothetical protein
MQVQVEIGGAIRRVSEADPQWINQQINARRRDGVPVCVRVTVEDSGVHLTLPTPGCESGGGSRPATAEERPILELWRRHRLDRPGFTGGDLEAFLKQLTR